MPAYSFKDVKFSMTTPTGTGLILGGPDGGVAEEGIKIEPVGNFNEMVRGADGTVMHSLQAGEPATCTITLQKTSYNNAILSALLEAQRAGPAATWGKNLAVLANANGDFLNLVEMAFQKQPGLGYTAKGENVEWVFDVGHYFPVLGAGV